MELFELMFERYPFVIKDRGIVLCWDNATTVYISTVVN
jgi:hypothetical protein